MFWFFSGSLCNIKEHIVFLLLKCMKDNHLDPSAFSCFDLDLDTPGGDLTFFDGVTSGMDCYNHCLQVSHETVFYALLVSFNCFYLQNPFCTQFALVLSMLRCFIKNDNAGNVITRSGYIFGHKRCR